MEVQANASVEATPTESADNDSRETSEEVTEENQEEVGEETNDAEDVGAGSHGDESSEEAPLTFKRKVNGKIVEVTEDELWRHYGKEVTAAERFEAAAQREKELDERESTVNKDKDALAHFFDTLKTKPEMAFDLIGKMGHDAKKIARQIVLEEMEYERMSPDAKEAFENKNKLKDYEEKEKLRKEEEESYQETLIRQQQTDNIDTVISEAVKLSGLQPKPKTVARIAEACQTLLSANKTGDLPTAEQINKKFLAYMRQDASDLMSEQDVDKLIELGLLNDTQIDNIAKWHLKKNKANLPSFSGTSKSAASKKPAATKKEPVGVNDFFKKLGSGR